MMFFLILTLALLPSVLADGCDDKASCYKDLAAYCRVAYPVEPISATLTESAYITETTTTISTQTFVGITDGRVKNTPASLSLRNASPSPTQTAPPSLSIQEDAIVKNLCLCIQSEPSTTIVATTTISFTSTATETVTKIEVYCRQGCHRDYEYCDTDAPPLKNDSLAKYPAGVCRPTGICDVDSDCTGKKGRKKCRCLIDNSDIEMDRTTTVVQNEFSYLIRGYLGLVVRTTKLT